MASGYFPLSKRDEDAKKLLQAVRLMNEVRENLYSATATNCVPEDAAYDGMFLGDIDKAVSLIAPCVEGHVTHRDCCVKVQGILISYLVPDNTRSAHDIISDILGVLDGPDWRAAEGILDVSSEAA